jgi:hypothetical protein
MKASGIVLFEGPSQFDSAPIVVVAVFHSENRKTGDMVQTYILRQDVDPVLALASGQDASICGDCKHRPGELGRSCYVNVGQSVLAVWRAYKAGRYPVVSPAQAARLVAGRMVRLGTYGDPAAVRARTWNIFLAHVAGHTGYTHAWNSSRARGLQGLAMASVDSLAELERAQAAGWRTFRVRLATEKIQARELACPASVENDQGRTCATCGACDGLQAGRIRQASVAIVAHGAGAKAFQRAALAA